VDPHIEELGRKESSGYAWHRAFDVSGEGSREVGRGNEGRMVEP